jgi:hypothetical protein
MPEVSALFSFVQGTYGWTEKYYTNKTSDNLQTYYDRATAIIQKRMLLCGAQTSAQYLRLSFEDVRGDSLLFSYPIGQPPPTAGKVSDAPTTCLLLNLADTTRTYKKLVYLRGIWDDQVDTGGRYKKDPVYESLVINFWSFLRQDGWGWMGTDRPTPKRKITAISQENDGTVRITHSGAPWPGADPYDNLAVRIAGVELSKNLNGLAVVVPQSPQVAITLRRIPIYPGTSGGRIGYVGKSLKLVDFGTISRVGEHRTGRPILQPRGRLPVRTRG